MAHHVVGEAQLSGSPIQPVGWVEPLAKPIFNLTPRTIPKTGLGLIARQSLG